LRSDALVFPTVRHSCLPIPETSDLTWEDDEEEEEEEEEEDEDEDADISLEEIPVKQVKRVAPQKQMSIAKVGGKNEVPELGLPCWAPGTSQDLHHGSSAPLNWDCPALSVLAWGLGLAFQITLGFCSQKKKVEKEEDETVVR
jgi:hypothetical protein